MSSSDYAYQMVLLKDDGQRDTCMKILHLIPCVNKHRRSNDPLFKVQGTRQMRIPMVTVANPGVHEFSQAKSRKYRGILIFPSEVRCLERVSVSCLHLRALYGFLSAVCLGLIRRWAIDILYIKLSVPLFRI